MMRACGFRDADFQAVPLPPAAAAYRAFLDRVSWEAPRERGLAVLTLFVEGSVHERTELASMAAGRSKTTKVIEAAVQRHPLVPFHGVDPAALELVRVHQRIEGGHRQDAWIAVLGSVGPELEAPVLAAIDEALARWLAYRDEVAQACGIARP